MSELTPSQKLFWKTEQLKKRYMKQGMTKKQALEQVRKDLVKQFPSDYAIGIEHNHITIRHVQPTDMGKTLTNLFGGAGNALEMLENLKKGFTNAVRNKEESQNGYSGSDAERGIKH